MEKEKIQIPFRSKIAVLCVQEIDGEFDVDDYIGIDYSNILGEILTFPVIFNRVANLRAEAANNLATTKFDFEVFEAQLYEKHRKELSAKSNGEGKKPTNKDVEVAVLLDPAMKQCKYKLIEAQKMFDYSDSLYWSAQSKDTKLNRMCEKLRPEEFENEIMEGTINGIAIKMVKKSIQD